MNKRDLLRKYGAWIILLLAYLGFHLLQNKAWIQDYDITIPDQTSSFPTTDTSGILQADLKTMKSDDTDFSRTPAPLTENSVISKKYTPKNISKTPPPDTVDVNTADMEEWKQFRGIGDYRAERIIRFRESLGGFSSVDQVAETYGLPDSVFIDIRPYLILKKQPLKFYINRLTYDEMHQHPYVTKQMAYLIIRHRQKEAPFARIKELHQLLDEAHHERLNKLEPYLDFSID